MKISRHKLPELPSGLVWELRQLVSGVEIRATWYNRRTETYAAKLLPKNFTEDDVIDAACWCRDRIKR